MTTLHWWKKAPTKKRRGADGTPLYYSCKLKGLANNQFLNFGELVVGDADKVSTLGEIADVDGLGSLGVDILVVNHAAAHVDEHAVDHTGNTFDVHVDQRGGGVGLEVHANAGSSRIDGDMGGFTLSEDELDGVVAHHFVKDVLIHPNVGR